MYIRAFKGYLYNPDKEDFMEHNLHMDIETGIAQWLIAVVGRDNSGSLFGGPQNDDNYSSILGYVGAPLLLETPIALSLQLLQLVVFKFLTLNPKPFFCDCDGEFSGPGLASILDTHEPLSSDPSIELPRV